MQNLNKCPKIKRFPCIEISPRNQWNYFTLWQDQSWRCRLEALHHKTGQVGAFFFPKAQLKRGECLEPTCAEDSIMILFSQVWVKIVKITPRNRQIREKAQSKLRDGELTPCNETMRGTQTGRCRYRWCFCLKLCRFFSTSKSTIFSHHLKLCGGDVENPPNSNIHPHQRVYEIEACKHYLPTEHVIPKRLKPSQ